MMMTSKGEREVERVAACDELRALLPVGGTAWTVLRKVSASGLTRWISVIVVDDCDVRDVTYLVARATGGTLADAAGHRALRVTGAGMDMGFALVYSLSRVLYPEGHACTGSADRSSRCPSNDHSNGDRDYTPGRIHTDGGYAVSQAWL